MPTDKPKQESKEIQKNESPHGLYKTKSTFKPSEGMVKWLGKSFELGYAASITDIAKETGLNRDNWYQWLDRDGFVEWWDLQWQKELKRTRWKLDSIGFKKAEKDYSFWRDMMNRTGNTIPEPSNIGQQINTQFNLPNASLERIAGQN